MPHGDSEMPHGDTSLPRVDTEAPRGDTLSACRHSAAPRPRAWSALSRQQWGPGHLQQSSACSQPCSRPCAIHLLVQMKAGCIKRSEREKEQSYKRKRRNHKLKERQKALLDIFFCAKQYGRRSVERCHVSASNDTEKENLSCE